MTLFWAESRRGSSPLTTIFVHDDQKRFVYRSQFIETGCSHVHRWNHTEHLIIWVNLSDKRAPKHNTKQAFSVFFFNLMKAKSRECYAIFKRNGTKAIFMNSINSVPLLISLEVLKSFFVLYYSCHRIWCKKN